MVAQETQERVRQTIADVGKPRGNPDAQRLPAGHEPSASCGPNASPQASRSADSRRSRSIRRRRALARLGIVVSGLGPSRPRLRWV